MLENGDGATIMLRMGMDRLPVKELRGLPYASEPTATEQDGQAVHVVHACDHDVHMTMGTATARDLAARQDEWQGTLPVIAQPADERGAGARMMLAGGLFEDFPTPDYNLSLHTLATLQAG